MSASAPATTTPLSDASTNLVPAANACTSWALAEAAEHWRHWLLSHAAGRRNDDIIASMLASQRAGLGAMPDWLGLAPEAFKDLIVYHFPALRQAAFPQPQRQLTPERAAEREELVQLLLKLPHETSAKTTDKAPERSTPDPSPQQSTLQQRWLAEIIAAGCMGNDHLWQDLGLWQRAELSRLMEQNFPTLAAKNCRDMKWKRFLYKQLCEAEGIYVCRSPSCEVCIDYHACFGPEN